MILLFALPHQLMIQTNVESTSLSGHTYLQALKIHYAQLFKTASLKFALIDVSKTYFLKCSEKAIEKGKKTQEK